VRHALSAERRGVDAISIDGFECAGHPGEDEVPGLILIPAATRQLKIPVIASGGIASGQGLAAALALGAAAVNMGTRLMATAEAPIHQNVKDQIVANDERSTVLVFRRFHNTARVARNSISEEIVEISEREGSMDDGMWWAGQTQGLIHDIAPVKDVIDTVIADAEEIIGRLPTLVS